MSNSISTVMKELKAINDRLKVLEESVSNLKPPPELATAMQEAARQGIVNALQQVRQNLK